MTNETNSVREITTHFLQTLGKALQQVDLGAIERITQRLSLARDSGAMVFLAGNGGSAATASHWANDLGKATKASGVKPFRVLSLSDNISWLTALANDNGYEHVFSEPMENFAQRGDVLVVISASGNSSNLLQAVDLATSIGVYTIGFLGFDGGLLKDRVDEYLWLPTEKGEYGLVESGHSAFCHVLTTCLMESNMAKHDSSYD